MKSIAVASVLSLALIGCGSETVSELSQDTATRVLNAALSSEPAEIIQLIQQQPEYANNIQCIAYHLDERGWDNESFDYFMKVTFNTGNFKRASREDLATANMMKLVMSMEDCS